MAVQTPVLFESDALACVCCILQSQSKIAELEAMKHKSDDLQNRVHVLQEESMQHSHVAAQMLSESVLGRSHDDAAADGVFVNFQVRSFVIAVRV